ncbi:MAG: hypothetical protein WC596_04205 [Candidatus Shapirobacteria bacterium]
MWIILLAGAVGGILRGVLGIAKDLITKKELTINWVWFGVTVLIAAILGMVVASFFAEDPRIAILGGYSGSDLVDGIMKLKLNELFKTKKVVVEEKKYGSFEGLIKTDGKPAKEKS